jgi:hypothetical protein
MFFRSGFRVLTLRKSKFGFTRLFFLLVDAVSKIKVAAALLGNFELKFDGGFSIRKFIVRIFLVCFGQNSVFCCANNVPKKAPIKKATIIILNLFIYCSSMSKGF